MLAVRNHVIRRNAIKSSFDTELDDYFSETKIIQGESKNVNTFVELWNRKYMANNQN